MPEATIEKIINALVLRSKRLVLSNWPENIRPAKIAPFLIHYLGRTARKSPHQKALTFKAILRFVCKIDVAIRLHLKLSPP